MQHEIMLHIRGNTYTNGLRSVVLEPAGDSAVVTTARGTYTLVKHPTQNYLMGILNGCKAHVIPGKPIAGLIMSYRLIYWTKKPE